MFKYLFVLILPNICFGYANFIGYGYKSCINCHYNPYGNGPLTDYGRGIGASMLADRILYRDDVTEDEISRDTGFLYSNLEKSNKYVRPSLNFRSLDFISGYGSDNEERKYIQMLTSASLAFKYGENDKYVAVVEYGFVPTPQGASEDEEVSNYRSREHYIGFRPSPNYGIYIGLMDKVYGIRIPDHNLFSRSVPQLTMNDQSHGVLLHMNFENVEAGIHVYQGNLFQDEEYRQAGTSGKLEYNLTKQARMGLSYLSSKNDYTGIQSQAVDLRVGFGKGSAIMLEYGQTTKDIFKDKTQKVSNYLTSQNYVRIRRGLHSLVTFEYLKEDIEEDGHLYRMGPGVQWFPIHGVEFRLDVYNKKNYSEVITSDDIWDIAGQLHLWF